MYFLIFGFSAQNGVESGSISLEVSKRLVEIANTVFSKEWSSVFRLEQALSIQWVVRKLAHFTEYAILGGLWGALLHEKKRGLLIGVSLIFVSACFDEFHQLFVPGRYGSFIDIVIDTSGGALGCFVTKTILHKWHSLCRKEVS